MQLKLIILIDHLSISLQLLLDKYAVEELKNVIGIKTNGATPLVIASKNGHLDIVRFLIEHGADIEQVKINSNANLHYAIINLSESENLINFHNQTESINRFVPNIILNDYFYVTRLILIVKSCGYDGLC